MNGSNVVFSYNYDANHAPIVNTNLVTGPNGASANVTMYQVTVTGDDGTPIDVYTPVSPTGGPPPDPNAMYNCLGEALADKQFWVDSGGAAQILHHDNYSAVSLVNPARGDIAVFSTQLDSNGYPIDPYHAGHVYDTGPLQINSPKGGAQPDGTSIRSPAATGTYFRPISRGSAAPITTYWKYNK
jgi:hypothetical protein